MSLYKIQPLLEQGFNFGVIFPEKQKSLQEHSGFNFGLQEIALLIKKQTHNFADKNDIALDIDKYLYEAYEKYKDATEPKEDKEPKKELSVDEKIKSFTGKINGYKIKLKRASAEDAEKIAKKIKGYEIKLKGLAIKKKNGGTILEEGGSVIEVTSSVQDPKPTGADETAFTRTAQDAEQMAKGGGLDKQEIKKRLEYLRGELRAEKISYGELAELQSLAKHIDEGDVELLEAAGVPEKHEKGGAVDNFSSHTDEWFDELIDYIKTEKEIDPNFHTLVAIAKSEATDKNLARFAKMMEECSCSNQKLKEKILGHIKNIQEGKYKKEFKHQYGGKGTGHGTSGKVSIASSFFDLFLQAVNYDAKNFEKGGGLGDSVHINDPKNNLHGKAGLIMGVRGKDYLLKVLHGGKEIDVTVPKKFTTPFPENID